jgi:hypothetical protein
VGRIGRQGDLVSSVRRVKELREKQRLCDNNCTHYAYSTLKDQHVKGVKLKSHGFVVGWTWEKVDVVAPAILHVGTSRAPVVARNRPTDRAGERRRGGCNHA